MVCQYSRYKRNGTKKPDTFLRSWFAATLIRRMLLRNIPLLSLVFISRTFSEVYYGQQSSKKCISLALGLACRDPFFFFLCKVESFYLASCISCGQRGLSYVLCILWAYLHIISYIAIIYLCSSYYFGCLTRMQYIQIHGSDYTYRLSALCCQRVWPFLASLYRYMNEGTSDSDHALYLLASSTCTACYLDYDIFSVPDFVFTIIG